MAMRVDEIARLVGGKVEGEGIRLIEGIAALEEARSSDLSFVVGPREMERAARSAAGCLLVPPGSCLPERTLIQVANPKFALTQAAKVLYPSRRPQAAIHPSAVVSPEAQLGPEVSVGAHAVIESRARIGARAQISAGVYVGKEAEIGSDCVLHPHVTVLSGAKIGNRVILHPGVVVGSDGFGYVFAEGAHQKFPQLGGVILEDDVEVGSNTTVDRGSLGTTRVGRGTKIDNLVQIAHNVQIGEHCIIAAQTGISGSATLEDGVVLGGQVGVADHVRIETQAVVGAQAGIPSGKVIRRGNLVWGTPARRLEEFKKQYAHLSRLPELARKVKEMTRKDSGRRR